MIPTPPTWRGFSFALHPTRCRAFILPGCNTAPYKRLQRVLCSQCNYIAPATKQRTGLYRGFSCDCTRSTAYDTRPIQAAIIPPAPRWMTYTAPGRSQPIPDTAATPDAAQPSTAVYYNKVYKRVQGVCLLWIHARRCSTSQTITAAPGQRSGRGGLAPSTRRRSPAARAQRAARNHWRLPPHLFSGFRPIANRGQQ